MNSYSSNPYIEYGSYGMDMPDLSGLETLPPSLSRALDYAMGKDPETQKALTKGTQKLAKTFGRAHPKRFAKSATVYKKHSELYLV